MSHFDQPVGLSRTRSQSRSSLGGSPPSVAHSPIASTSALPPPHRRPSSSPVIAPLRSSSRRQSGDAVAQGPFTPAALREGPALRNRRPSGAGSVIDLTNSSQADLFASPNIKSAPLLSSSAKKRTRDEANGHPPPRPYQPDPFAPTKQDQNPENAPSLSTLTCPICLGPPTPFALTSCGHAFCAPCLHSALVAGPALTPPPPDLGRPSGSGPGTLRGRLLDLAGRNGGGAGRNVNHLFMPSQRGRNGGGSGGTSAHGTDDEEEPSELDKRCPLCRTVLKGGWGRSLRGVTLRVLPKKVPALPPADLTDEDDDEEEGGGGGAKVEG